MNETISEIQLASNQSQATTAILLVNLGTPDKPTPGSVYSFLSRFLSDPRVVDLPSIPWRILLHTLILPIRSFRLAKLYQSIWTSHGSPLKNHTERLCAALEKSLKKSEKITESWVLRHAMTYSNPNLKQVLKEIIKLPVARLIVIPLFPQFSSTTTLPIWDIITKTLKPHRVLPSIHFIHEYSNEISYIQTLSESITEFWNQHGQSKRLLFSFHGMPKRYSIMGDPYIQSCETLVKALAKMLKIPENFYEISFQSRFGYASWHTPTTEDVLTQWARQGIKSVDVISPSFAVDCLETLEEINIQMRHVFMNAGGEKYQYIPALNDKPAHVNALKALIEKFF